MSNPSYSSLENVNNYGKSLLTRGHVGAVLGTFEPGPDAIRVLRDVRKVELNSCISELPSRTVAAYVPYISLL